jgi:shikimate dehydrogenase
VLHRAAYDALGLPGWTYRAVDVDEAGLEGFLAECAGDGWAGWSLTMPLKRAVRPLLVRESDLARDVGAVNTVLVAPDGLEGFNTDVHGIVEALRECGVPAPDAAPDAATDAAPDPVVGAPAAGGEPLRAAVLGGGATAASAVAALKDLGCTEPVVHVRSAARAADLLEAAERLAVRPVLAPFDAEAMIGTVAAVDVVISTLPAGVADGLVPDGVAAAARARRPVLLDVVYDPWPTSLAAAWTAAGAPVVGGFVMLVHQAYGQVHLMTGLRPPVAEMRAAGEAALRERSLQLAPNS